MTEKAQPDDQIADAVRRALDAAQVATDAAHEAEAVIAARSEAAQAMARTARHSGWLAGAAASSSLLMLASGGAAWFKAASHLHDAAEVQATAAAGFIERIGEFNRALDRMDIAVTAAETHSGNARDTLEILVSQVDDRLTALASATEAAAGATAHDDAALFDKLHADLLMAIAEVELSLIQRLEPSPLPSISAQTTAPAASRPATDPVVPPRPTARPQPAQPRPANPFRFP